MTATPARWRTGTTEAERDQLADALDRLHALLVEHLAAEEQHILPLAFRSLTAEEGATSVRTAWRPSPGTSCR
ncbi:MAG: hypothetical protein JWR70_747 [Modestobacter sp.]|jgi:hemerythrin-like domain-containing protein|nr:hypothetical protein [Modestobacter sp.]